MKPSLDDLFRGRWAFVTGASSGLGEEFARQLAEHGAHLVLTARSVDRLRALAAQLGAAHAVQVRVIGADLAAEGGVEALLRELDALGVPIDHVIANAGFGLWGPFVERDERSQTEMVRVNCEAVVGVVRHCLPGIVARQRGGVLLIASTAAFQPMPSLAVYGATKAFVLSFGQAIAEELRGTGVRVSVVCPGPVPTAFHQRAGIEIPDAYRWAVVSAQECVRRALAGYAARRRIVIPGALNQVGALVARLVPHRVLVPVVRRMLPSRPSSNGRS
jgi:hypothetical protein